MGSRGIGSRVVIPPDREANQTVTNGENLLSVPFAEAGDAFTAGTNLPVTSYPIRGRLAFFC